MSRASNLLKNSIKDTVKKTVQSATKKLTGNTVKKTAKKTLPVTKNQSLINNLANGETVYYWRKQPQVAKTVYDPASNTMTYTDEWGNGTTRDYIDWGNIIPQSEIQRLWNAQANTLNKLDNDAFNSRARRENTKSNYRNDELKNLKKDFDNNYGNNNVYNDMFKYDLQNTEDKVLDNFYKLGWHGNPNNPYLKNIQDLSNFYTSNWQIVPKENLWTRLKNLFF